MNEFVSIREIRGNKKPRIFDKPLHSCYKLNRYVNV
jgi:hypothetical protein